MAAWRKRVSGVSAALMPVANVGWLLPRSYFRLVMVSVETMAGKDQAERTVHTSIRPPCRQ